MTQIYLNSTTYRNYNYPSGGTNNGKVSSIATSGETVTYQYDSLNRMLSAAGSGWAETYGYDSFGNLSSKTPTLGTPPSLSQASNPANNQIVGQGYDANGNQVTAPGFSGYATYDPENRMVSAPGIQYGYDSRNRRGWAGTVDSSNNLTGQTIYFYGPGGKRLGTYTLNVKYTTGQLTDPPANVAVYFGGKRLDISEDRLGSNIAIPLYPWGEDRGSSGNDQVKFATYTRDSATLLDYANNRYYSNAYGRFMTPDPYTNSGRLNDPQSWNRYAYAGGDPANRVDPSGLDFFAPTSCSDGVDCTPGGTGYCDPSQGPGACDNTCVAADGFTPVPSPDCSDDQDAAQATNSTVTVCGGQLTSGKIYDYCNVARSGAQWNAFNSVLSNLKKALKIDPDCADWLFNTTNPKTVNRDIKNLSGYFATASYIVNGEYVVGTENDLDPTRYAAIIINWANVGSVPQAVQFLDILHELAHVFNSNGIVKDGLSPSLSAKNDQTVMSHCDKAIDY